MNSHIESFNDITNSQLVADGDLIEGNQLVAHLLHTITDPSFDNIVIILSTKDGLDFDNAFISLIQNSQWPVAFRVIN